MRIPPLAPVLLLAIALGLPGAARAQGTGVPVPAAPRAPWLVFAAKPGIVAALDTSRIEHDSAGTRIRIRVDYGEPVVLPENPSISWTRMEATHVVDCGRGVARDVDMSVFDASGTRVSSYVWDAPQWTSFERHGLGTAFWRPLCAALAARGR